MQNCIFCQIVAGEKPAYKIYEDNDLFAFLDMYPHCYGHTLIIPKTHYRYIWDIPNPGSLLNLAQKITSHFKTKLPLTTCYSTIFGEKIAHAHLHLLPVLSNDTTPLTITFSHTGVLDSQTAQAIVSNLKLS